MEGRATGGERTVSGGDGKAAGPGTELKIGEGRLLIPSYTSPCEKIAFSCFGNEYTRISQKLHPGWSRLSARVLAGGLVTVGDAVEIGG